MSWKGYVMRVFPVLMNKTEIERKRKREVTGVSFYFSYRMKGTVKKELREIFEPIALEGKWKEASNPVLREFGELEPVTRYVPCGFVIGPKRWKEHPWERSYNKKTGEWVCEFSINSHGCDWLSWENEILPYCMESIQYYESRSEESGEFSVLYEFDEDWEKKPIGYMEEAGVVHSIQELKKDEKEKKIAKMPEARYKKGDVVAFQCYKAIKKGRIVVVDAHGTFFQQEEPFYDIEVTDDPFGQNGWYKHIQQSWILPTTDVEVTKFKAGRIQEVTETQEEHIREVGQKIIQKHIGALKELAKWD